MDTLQLPTTDIRVPPFAIGAMFWGTTVSSDVAHRILDRAVDLGANFIDTANNYPAWLTGGYGDESELCLAEWIASRGAGARDRLVLATKVGARPRQAGDGSAEVRGLGREAVLDQVEGSLQRLGVDHVDLLYAHIDDQSVGLEETVGALQEVVRRGWARAIAGSNLTSGRIRQAVAAAGDGPRYTAVQNRFTLLTPGAAADFGRWQRVLDERAEEACVAEDIAMVGYSTLLQGAYTRQDRPIPDDYRGPDAEPVLQALNRIAHRLGIDAGQAVLSWQAHRRARVLPVVGVSSVAQLESARTGIITPMGISDADELDRLRGARR
ncbi:aldo/keto reductase [Microbacterium sp. 22242]|uniref:aldo/keto reductase n=1 Tax=Microbacterium sp. 22242 TaxID=3453896 RepID=UPI003F84AE12